VVVGASHAPAPFGDQFLTFVSEDKEHKKYEIVETLTLDGTDKNALYFDAGGNGIEQCQANPRDGKFYLAVPKAANGYGAVLRISGTAPFVVEQVFSIMDVGCIPPLGGPAGLTIGPDHQILVGCNGSSTQSVIIDDPDNDRPHRYVATTWGVDEVWYDSGSNHYYLAQNCSPTGTPACTSSAFAIMNVEDAFGKQPHDPNALTAMGSKNPAADPDRNFVYLPVLALKTPAGGICSTTPDVNGNKSGSDLQGCIAIYSAPLDGDDRGGK
jgi:hypothetical protein